LGLTVTNGALSDLTWLDVYVKEAGDALGTDPADWGWVDPKSNVAFSREDGVRAVVDPYSGDRVCLLWPKSRRAGVSIAGKDKLVFWLKYLNSNIPAFQGANPIITLYESEERFVRLTPKGDLVGNPPHLEGRDGWTFFVVPLAGGKEWKRKGEPIETVNYLTIGFDSFGAGALTFWIDGLAFDRDRDY
jgi:hypothetical protein